MAKNPNRKKCGANKASGGKCGSAAGAGTAHLGSGRCSRHGGSSPNGNKAAARAQIYDMATEADASPFDVIIKAIRLDWGAVNFIRTQLATLDPEEEGIDSEERVRRTGMLVAWQSQYKEWLDQAVKHSKIALDAGVAEREVRLEERKGELLAGVLRTIIDGLGPDTCTASKGAAAHTRCALGTTGTGGLMNDIPHDLCNCGRPWPRYEVPQPD